MSLLPLISILPILSLTVTTITTVTNVTTVTTVITVPRGKFGGHHISLYVEKYEKKVNRIMIISKLINCKRSKFFFVILSGDSILGYPPTKIVKLVF